MSDRTNQFFNVPLVKAIIVAWINPERLEYCGDCSWYVEGKYFSDAATKRVIVLENGYKVAYNTKGYGPYRNITNKPGQIKRFIANVAKGFEGARMVNFYDPGRKPPNFLFQLKM
jgi:hypothetical protein